MLFLIPKPLHRAAYQAAHAVRKAWWRLSKKPRRGVMVIALNAEGEVLLLRQSYGGMGWVAPSGGIDKGEDPLAAALRECAEETGLVLEEPTLAAISEELVYGAPHSVFIYKGRVNGTPVADGREIVEARFFALDGLPRDLRNRLSHRLTLAGVAHSKGNCSAAG